MGPSGWDGHVLGGRRYALMESPYGCDRRRRDADLASSIEAGRRPLLEALGVRPRSLHSRAELLTAFGEPDPRPLVFFYLGHAAASEAEPRRTELCLEDGRMAVDDLLAGTHAGVGYTVLVLDACGGAAADVRRSPVPTAVLSASTLPVRTRPGEPTALAALMPRALECADANGNGWVEDRELAEALAARTERTEPGHSVFPRLRRQAWRALPVIARERSPACPAAAQVLGRGCQGPEPATAPGLPGGPLAEALLRSECELTRSTAREFFWASEAFFVVDPSQPDSVAPPPGTDVLSGPRERLRWVADQLSASEGFELVRTRTGVALERLRDGKSMGKVPPDLTGALVERIRRGQWALAATGLDGTFVWHGGKVEDRVDAADGRSFPGERLRAVPCSGALFGQCFEVHPAAHAEGVKP